VTGETEFAINRLDWNIAYPGAPDNLIQDKVVLTVKLVAPNPTRPRPRERRHEEGRGPLGSRPFVR
jgi:hypothetical protein